jgi:hypothetical protein
MATLLIHIADCCTCLSTIVPYTDTIGVTWQHCSWQDCSSGCNVKYYLIDYAGNPHDVYQCEACVLNCQNCASTTTCSTCILGYTYVSPTLCLNCPLTYGPGCVHCHGSNCLVCAPSYGVNGLSRTFINSFSNCQLLFVQQHQPILPQLQLGL